MIIEGQGHFFIIYFPGFVCFVLYLAKISGERLQDHWSSGFWFNWEKNILFGFGNDSCKGSRFYSEKNHCITSSTTFVRKK